jgi:DNA ligase (NAD+)
MAGSHQDKGRVTGHNAGLVQKKQIGIGARIEVIRSGEVIPKVENVVEPSDSVLIPTACPECAALLEWNNDLLKCTNRSCRAQITQSISHWFKTLGNADWFGIKTIQRLVLGGHDSLEKVYAMQEQDFLDLGFGPVQSRNLADAIVTSKSKQVEDWRFLAAFGIPALGTGDSRKLLSHIALEDLLHEKAETIETIDGFGEITSREIERGVEIAREIMGHMLSLGFNLEKTPLFNQIRESASPVAGKHIVFTGKMSSSTREEAQAVARRLGAIVQTGISGKTDYLVCGENVGAGKIKKATASNVQILSEREYYDLIEDDGSE